MKALLATLLSFALSASAATVNWTNTAGMNSTAYGPGDTINLWGTFTNTFTITNSGTAGNPITFYFEPGAKFSAPTFSGNWINLDAQSWITIDGGGHGVIELTDNGTSVANGGTHTYQNSVTALYGAGAGVNNITLENLTIRNLYKRQTNTEAQVSTTAAIYFIGSGLTYSNLFIDSAMSGIVQTGGLVLVQPETAKVL